MEQALSIPSTAASVFQKMDFGHHKAGVREAAHRKEFPRAETHGIASWPQNRLLADSSGLGWHDVYTSLATERSWNRTLPAVPHLCLAYCLHGVAAVSREIEGERGRTKAELRPRLLGVVPENRSSVWDLRGSPDIQLVYLHRTMVEQVAEEVLGVDRARIEIVPGLGFADPLLEQLMLALLDAAHHDDSCTDGLYADHIARLMALHMLRRYSARDRTRAAAALELTQTAVLAPRMRHMRELIDSALDKDLSLARLAREAGIGAHAFSAAFLRSFGVTPHRYVMARRIERAKELLRCSQMPVAEVALQTGFSSQSHLATVFRRVVGPTPGEYQSGGRVSRGELTRKR